jgi:hypothetical protein
MDPPPAAGLAEAAAQQLGIERAVIAVAELERLACRPFSSGPNILSCRAIDVNSRSAALTLVLHRAGSGYEVSIEQAFALPGSAGAVCAVERRLAGAIDSELGLPIAKADTRSTCPRR